MIWGGALGLALLAASGAASAQTRNEVGLVMGATVTPSRELAAGPVSSLTINPSLAMGLEYDRQVFSAGDTEFYLGGDFLASPRDVKLSNPPPSVGHLYAYLFLTPHVRVKFNASGAFSPWLQVGGGYARFLEAVPATATNFTQGTNTGTLVFGGGVDSPPVFRVFGLAIGFRGEVRDFYSGSPNYGQPTSGSLQHNIALTGGFLVRF